MWGDEKKRVAIIGETRTTLGGYIRANTARLSIGYQHYSAYRFKTPVSCPKCGMTGYIAQGCSLRRSDPRQEQVTEELVAIDGALIVCGCPLGSHRLQVSLSAPRLSASALFPDKSQLSSLIPPVIKQAVSGSQQGLAGGNDYLQHDRQEAGHPFTSHQLSVSSGGGAAPINTTEQTNLKPPPLATPLPADPLTSGFDFSDSAEKLFGQLKDRAKQQGKALLKEQAESYKQKLQTIIDTTLSNLKQQSGSVLPPFVLDKNNPLQFEEPKQVFTRSCLRDEGCTDEGTNKEPATNFGSMAVYALPLSAAVGTANGVNPLYPVVGKALRGTFATLAEIKVTPLTVGLMGMLYSPPLNSGEGDFLTDAQLALIAASGGTAPTRVRFRWETNAKGELRPVGYHVGARSGYDQVPVREMTYNKFHQRYEFWEDENANGPTIFWTPAEQEFKVPNHTGHDQLPTIPPMITVLPIPEEQGGWIETFPEGGERSFRDYILILPIPDLPAVYVYFSKPYGEVTEKGKYSGREFNPSNAGGPIVSLDWRTAKITQEGIDKVKLHTSRFGHSPANAIMIDRLERILRNELVVTNIDKRFYTHEIRELERYRAVGISDRELGSSIWNDTHTATLEDFKVNEKKTSLYTQEAIDAQDLYDFNEAMK